MKGKKAEFDFFGYKLVDTVVSIAVVFVLAVIALNLTSPADKAEASSKKLLADIADKVSRLEDGSQKNLIAFGFLDREKWLIGMDSGYFPINIDKDLLRPEGRGGCGARSNSCICICKSERCTEVVECKAFPREKVSSIVQIQGSSMTALKIMGDAPVTARLTLDSGVLEVQTDAIVAS